MRACSKASGRHVAADVVRGVTAASRDDMIVVGLRRLGVWDAGDLSRLRRAVTRLRRAGHGRIGIDLSSVSRLPPGFAALLWGWQDGGMAVSLIGAGPEVREMLWFRLSAIRDGGDRWRIVAPRGDQEPSPEPVAAARPAASAAAGTAVSANRAADDDLWPWIRTAGGGLELRG